jgi:uncharacterized protein
MLGLIFSLSIPTTVFGNEITSQSSLSEHHRDLNPLDATNAARVNAIPNINLPSTTNKVKENIQSSTKGPIIDKNKHHDRFIQKAVQFVEDMQKGDYQHALKSSTHALKKGISEQWLESYWTTLPLQLNKGAFIGIGDAKVEEANRVHTNVEIQLNFEQGSVPMTVRLERSGKVDDFLVTPPMGIDVIADDPSYSNPDTFTEKDVVIGKGDFAVPGTLSIPKGKGPFPVVVLVQGSGASDKDETIYAVKPFRDLAYGLASKGIAVLRYNKRTFEHPIKTITDPNHTVDKETTDDALLATRLLEKEKKIDDDQIFILGHSQGGMMVPQMINQDNRQNIAGAIIMGGPARTIQDVILDQFDYLFSIGQLPPAMYEFMKGQFEMLNDPNFSGEQPPEGFQLGQAVFWDSINDIKAAEMAKEQTVPLLIIQGERDYQVLSDTEIPIWKKELSHRNNIEYQLYPKLNHLFTEGEGEMSTPAEYLIPANIPEYVINDIVEWVESKPK